ncbi:MAG: hypothetical protein M3406_12540 [Chloroflexota bacterium]|nr:hypothetical protein [Chloroflexota bacterium]
MPSLSDQLAHLADPIQVDLGDLEDMRRKLPAVTERARAARVIRAAQSKLTALGQQAEHWERLETVLRELVPDTPSDAPSNDDEAVAAFELSAEPAPADRRTLGSVDSAVAILEQADEPMSVAQVHAQLPQFSRKTVGWALWKAKQLDRAKSMPGKGVYAPMSYQPMELAPTADPFAPAEEGGEA